MRIHLIISGICAALCAPGIGGAQDPLPTKVDSTAIFSRGNIADKVFEVETIDVRPECPCAGLCQCGNDAADQGKHRFSTTDEVLGLTPRVSLIKRGNFAFEPVLNGMNSERFNLTIDGMKVFAACTDKMDPVSAYVETNNLQSVSVHSGVAGGEFGSTIAGSIDMQTAGAKLRPDTPFSGEIGGGYQSAAGGYTGLFSLNHSGDRYAVSAKGGYRKAGNYRAGGGEVIRFSQFEKWNGSLSGLFLLGDNGLIRADVIMDDAYNVGYPALPMDVGYAKARIFGLTHRHAIERGAVGSVETKVYANTVEHVMDDTQRPDVFMHMDMPGETQTYGAYTKVDLRFGRHEVLVKADGYHANSRAEMTMYPPDDNPMLMLTWPDVDKLSFGLYVQDRWTLGKKDRLIIAGRIETLANTVRDAFGIDQATVFNQDLTGTDRRIMPTANLTYQRDFGENLHAWITGGYTERAPSISEQYAFYIFNAFDGYDYIGLADLNNERSLQGEWGVEADPGAWTIRATAFHYYIRDYILGITQPDVAPMTHGARGVKMYANTQEARMSGAHLQLGYAWKSGWTASAQSSYTRGSDAEGNALPLIPAFANNAALRYDFGRSFVQAELESALKQTRVDEFYGEEPTPGYALIHLRGGTFFEWGAKRLSLNAGVENILDEKYTQHLDWGGIFRPGRNVYLNASYAF